MSFDTIIAITENIRDLLQAKGIKFSHKAYDDVKSVPASLLPLGQIFYAGEAFESPHGERPSYSEAEFAVKVLILEKDPERAVGEQQRWAHNIREALTVNALNTGALAATKRVSRVNVARADAENHKDNLTSLTCKVFVRYREA